MSDEQKIWTFGDALDKVRKDVDLTEDDPDEEFVSFDEFAGYFNDGINEAQSEIVKIDEEYFLSKYNVPLVTDEDEYILPPNILAQKIRGIMYANGTTIYPVKKFRRMNKFENIAMAAQYGESADYMYYLLNDRPGQVRLVTVPPSREDAVVPPMASPFTPMQLWFIRGANKVPLTGEYCNREDILPTAVNTGTSVITVDPIFPYVTGNAVKLSLQGAATLPSPLVAGTVYYVIRLTDTTIQLASTLQNARAGTEIPLTTQGTLFFSMKVAATTDIMRATVLDIPEFTTFIMEWVKTNCMLKDGDPRLPLYASKTEAQRKLMVDTLTTREPDDESTVEMDYSIYQDLS